MFCVFDLDGTLCDITHRVHHVRDGNHDWDAFFAACGDDAPIWSVINLLNIIANDELNHVEIWSGRSDAVKAETGIWLMKHGISSAHLTRMRPSGNYTPDDILKQSWLDDEKENGRGQPCIIFDDRQRVVDMWRKNGVTCAQVAPGDFDSPKDKVITPFENHGFENHGVLLTLLVGPSGAGKDVWLHKHLFADLSKYSQVVSSDQNRQWLTGDLKDQTRNADMWAGLHSIVKARLRAGMPTIVNATNIRNRDRKSLLDLLPKGEFAKYVVINRPLQAKMETRDWRPEWLVEKHHNTFMSNLKAIMAGDNDPRVLIVEDLRDFRGWR